MLDTLATFFSVLLMIIGFGFVIFIHELGHFLAARWAGIRAPAFAVGFGSAICSWRRGMGFRRGSSEPEYKDRLRELGQHPETGRIEGVSETEYRLNWFPFGGYVKMLGQEDLNPGARSASPDSYNAKSVPKRMVVISAGVVMNIILAAVLFMIVFMFGMRDVPPIIGDVAPDGPADVAGLQPGDRVISIGDSHMDTFTEVMINVAMARPNRTLDITVQRPGVEEPVTLTTTPERGEVGLNIGVAAAGTNRLIRDETGDDDWRRRFDGVTNALGLTQLKPGMTLVEIGGKPVATTTLQDGSSVGLLNDVRNALAASGGEPVAAVFSGDDGERVEVQVEPRPEMQRVATMTIGESAETEHLLGLRPVMKVVSVAARGEAQGLRSGDVFARVGGQRWPSILEGIREIRERAGSSIKITVARDGAFVDLTANVQRNGQIGFGPGAAYELPIVSSVPTPQEGGPLPADRILPPLASGTRIESINGATMTSFADIRRALGDAVAATEPDAPVEVALTLRLLDADSLTEGPTTDATWTLTPDDVAALDDLGWRMAPQLAMLFDMASMIMKADNPLHAVQIGVEKTHWIVMQTYLTFVRLFQGTVRVENLKGPVGITHIGSQFASEGMIPFLFFLALISANLAVINFLPIPVADGGQFVMLLVEGVTRRPVPVAVQNLATLIGIALIGVVFLTVTFNDIRALIAP